MVTMSSKCQEAVESSPYPVKKGTQCARLSVRSKLQQSKIRITGAGGLSRRPSRRRPYLARATRSQAPLEVLRQDLCPIRERRPLMHRKARPAPSSGKARGLSLEEPPTLPRSRGRRSGTTWRGAFKHASLMKAQVRGDQTLRSSLQGTPMSYKSPESCAAAAAYLPWPHIQARMEDCASASTYQGSTEPRPSSAYGLRP